MPFIDGLSKLPKALQAILGVSLVLVIGGLDFLTGSEASFAVFYIIPVGLVSWLGHQYIALSLSVLTGITWVFLEWVERPALYSSTFILAWNMVTRSGIFFLAGLIVSVLKGALIREKEYARTDYLTGAANTRAFFDLAGGEIYRSRRYNHPFSILYMDIDDFKLVNDRFGHSVGDTVLREVVEIMKANLRVIDTVARLGGDEFAILLPETGAAAALVVGQKIQQTLQYEVHNRGWPVTFSIGILTCLQPPGSVDELISRVDATMYAVKKAGKNSIKHELYPGQAPPSK